MTGSDNAPAEQRLNDLFQVQFKMLTGSTAVAENSARLMAGVALRLVRPAIYREAAEYLYENQGTCDQCGNAADEVLRSRADELEKDRDDT